MKTPPSPWIATAAILISMFLGACDREEGPALEVGKFCTIQFRRDALGAAASTPVPPTTDTFNGADTNVQGKLKRVTKDWIVLEYGAGEMWIPKGVVLLIKQ